MDLDKIKKEWQETPLQINIGEEKIGQMIDNKGQSAFRRRLKYERTGLVAAVILWFLSPIFSYPELVLVYRITITLGFFWQLYKVICIRKVNLSRMSILDISRFYIHYKKIISYETIISLIWFWAFVGYFAYLEYLHNDQFIEFGIYVFSIIFGIAFIVCLWMIWQLQWKHIRRLGRSIQEVQELERDNP